MHNAKSRSVTKSRADEGGMELLVGHARYILRDQPLNRSKNNNNNIYSVPNSLKVGSNYATAIINLQ